MVVSAAFRSNIADNKFAVGVGDCCEPPIRFAAMILGVVVVLVVTEEEAGSAVRAPALRTVALTVSGCGTAAPRFRLMVKKTVN